MAGAAAWIDQEAGALIREWGLKGPGLSLLTTLDRAERLLVGYFAEELEAADSPGFSHQGVSDETTEALAAAAGVDAADAEQCAGALFAQLALVRLCVQGRLVNPEIYTRWLEFVANVAAHVGVSGMPRARAFMIAFRDLDADSKADARLDLAIELSHWLEISHHQIGRVAYSEFRDGGVAALSELEWRWKVRNARVLKLLHAAEEQRSRRMLDLE